MLHEHPSIVIELHGVTQKLALPTHQEQWMYQTHHALCVPCDHRGGLPSLPDQV